MSYKNKDIAARLIFVRNGTDAIDANHITCRRVPACEGVPRIAGDEPVRPKQTLLHVALERGVGAVGNLLQPFAVENGDETASVGDQTRARQFLKGSCHA